ncbi:MAG TPA: tetratricopeptide repeat protein [Candidatus Saccharimonadales bacterium]|nr:tetratricopeptide repeat protein [Candidatus Saccharimonadales bacterium]
MRIRAFRVPRVRLLFLALCVLTAAGRTDARRPDVSPATSRPQSTPEGVFLVFPFENVGAPPRLDWIGEGLEELTIQRLSATGQQVYSHAGRLNEMDLYGIPPSGKISRATMLHIAEELDADYIVFGDFSSDGTKLMVRARILRTSPVNLFPAVTETGPLTSLMELHTKVVWRLLSEADHTYPLSLNEFARLQRRISLAAFEQYIRGLLSNDDETRLRDLKEAARLEPDAPEPAFAIGEVYFQKNECSSALPWFAKVPRTHALSVEAIFSSGVCRLRLGQPDKAQQLFAELREGLQHNLVSGADLPEILNNLGVAQARQDELAAARTAIGRAGDINPDEDDYPFNLGLLALQQKDFATAQTYFADAVQRRPDSPEDRAFLLYTLEKAGKKEELHTAREAAQEEFGETRLPQPNFDAKHPESLAKYQRIKPELETTSLRLELQGPVQSASTSTTSAVTLPSDGAAAHLRQGRQQMRAGRLDVAEREFRAALVSDPHNATAHRELAEIYRRRGKLDDAAKELHLSLAELDSAATRTALARIYLEQKKPDLARSELEKAVKLAPNYADAKELLNRLDKTKATGGVS